jgi:hypothetical protein
MYEDNPGQRVAVPFSFPDSSPPPSLKPVGLSLFVPGGSVPGPLASQEVIEAYRRRCEEEAARKPSPPPWEPSRSLLDILGDTFDAGRRVGREEGEKTSRADKKTSTKPHMPTQEERDRDEILALMGGDLTLSGAKKDLRKRLRKEGEHPKTISNRLSKASLLVRNQLSARNP